MDRADCGAVRAYELRGDPTRLFKLSVGIPVPSRLAQPPMQMQLVGYLAGIGIGPPAAARHDNGRRAKNAFQSLAGRLRGFVAFDGQHEPTGEVDPLRVALRPEGRDRRTEHDFLAGVGALAGEP